MRKDLILDFFLHLMVMCVYYLLYGNHLYYISRPENGRNPLSGVLRNGVYCGKDDTQLGRTEGNLRNMIWDECYEITS